MAGITALARSMCRLSLTRVQSPKLSRISFSLGKRLSTSAFGTSKFPVTVASVFSRPIPHCDMNKDKFIFQIHNMSTLNSIHKYGLPKKKVRKRGALDGCPQKKGVVLKVIIKKPKKPNSANRKCVRVKLSNSKQIVAYIPGEGNNLQEHNMVLIKGGGKQDLPGVKHRVVRGVYDCSHVVKKEQ